MDAYAAAVSEYNRMHSAQVAAVRRGEDFPFEGEIAAAGLRMENANTLSCHIEESTDASVLLVAFKGHRGLVLRFLHEPGFGRRTR
jgi:hypothetical protein